MTAVYITAIIAVTLLASSIITAVAKHATANRADAAAIDRVRILHRKATHGDDCVHCAAFGPGYDNTWPCQTIRALNGAPTEENSA